MICQRCARAADVEADMARAGIDIDGGGHDVELCADFGKDINACGCQHRPLANTTELPDGAR